MKTKAGEPAPAAPYTQTIGQAPGKLAPLTSDQATAAMNFLQDLRMAPHVQSVKYDDAADSYMWTGPTTGKQMGMPRTDFQNQIWIPYQATTAMNFLQDKRDAPEVRSVDYDAKTDSYLWKGPTR